MIILDTNVISEIVKPVCDPNVARWFRAQASPTLFVSTITEAELLFGVECIPAGRRRDALRTLIEKILRERFAGKTLTFDSTAARNYAQIAAVRRASGRPIGYADCQIAAIARSRGAAVASRDADGFGGCGIQALDPWNDPVVGDGSANRT